MVLNKCPIPFISLFLDTGFPNNVWQQLELFYNPIDIYIPQNSSTLPPYLNIFNPK